MKHLLLPPLAAFALPSAVNAESVDFLVIGFICSASIILSNFLKHA